jgi:hypothetical protein
MRGGLNQKKVCSSETSCFKGKNFHRLGFGPCHGSFCFILLSKFLFVVCVSSDGQYRRGSNLRNVTAKKGDPWFGLGP